MNRTFLRAFAATLAFASVAAADPANGQVATKLNDKVSLSDSDVRQAKPMSRKLNRIPPEALRSSPAYTRGGGQIKIQAGWDGHQYPADKGGDDGSPRARLNYGGNNQNTIFHYSDYLVDSRLRHQKPYRFVGRFAFKTSSGNRFYCSASMISKSIAVVAGHCVHDGGNKDKGWIQSGTFFQLLVTGHRRNSAKQEPRLCILQQNGMIGAN